MRHGVAGRKLGRSTSQRQALLRGLITELFRHERISTTEAKAHFMRGDAEHLISVAKRGLAEGGNNVHAHRQVARVLTDPEITKRLFNEIAPRFSERPGGYTRIVKVGQRLGDGAEMVLLELVEKAAPVTEAKGKEKEAKTKGKDKEAKAKDKGPGAKAKGKDNLSQTGKVKGSPSQTGDTKAKGKATKGKETKAPSK